MKTKFTLIYGLLLGTFLIAACDKDDDDKVPEKNTLPPGPEYVKEGNYCLNAVCYMAKGEDTLNGWHAVYSAWLKLLQAEFKEQMALCGYPDKTFHLEVNKQNPEYVNIIRIEGQTDSVSKRGYSVVAAEVEEYFNQHPEKKQSNFTLIFVPNVSLSFRAWLSEENGKLQNSFVIFPGLSYSLSKTQIGTMMQNFGKLCLLDNNTEPMSEIYTSMMNQDKGPANWRQSSRLMKADAMWLNQNQIFNNKTNAYFTDAPEVKVNHTELKYDNGQIVVTCEFTSPQNVVGVMVYHDPWSYPDREDEIWDNNYTTRDAIPYVTDQVNKNGNTYKITVLIPWSDLPVTYQVPESVKPVREAEIRFRFLIEDGLAVPLVNKGDIKSGFRYPYQITNYLPDFDTPVDVELEIQPEE